jgi:hypothetical protein
MSTSSILEAEVITYAGIGKQRRVTDGYRLNASFSSPFGICYCRLTGYLYISDANLIRGIDRHGMVLLLYHTTSHLSVNPEPLYHITYPPSNLVMKLINICG